MSLFGFALLLITLPLISVVYVKLCFKAAMERFKKHAIENYQEPFDAATMDALKQVGENILSAESQKLNKNIPVTFFYKNRFVFYFIAAIAATIDFLEVFL